MDHYFNVLDKLFFDVKTGKIDLRDYIRIKRSKTYNKLLYSKFGILFLIIDSYKYDYEKIPYEQKTHYELIKVNDIFMEACKLSDSIK